MDTAARPMGELEQGLLDDWETPPDMLCLMPTALAGPVGRARAALAEARAAKDLRQGAETAQRALAELSGVHGAAATDVRERLSRLWHRLTAEIARVQVGGVAAVAVEEEPASGLLGPVERACDECGELLGPEHFGAVKGTHTPHTTCRSCRAKATRARRQESGGLHPRRMRDETMGAAALRLETAEAPALPKEAPKEAPHACTVCGKSEPEVRFQRSPFGDGTHLKATCIACTGQKAAATRLKRRKEAEAEAATPPEAPQTLVCRYCGVEKPVDEMLADKHRPGGYDTRCKACMADRARKRREDGTAPAAADPLPAPPAPAIPQPPLIPFGRLVPVGDLLAAGRDLPRTEPCPTSWATAAAPAMLAAGLLGLAAWVLGRVFHAE